MTITARSSDVGVPPGHYDKIAQVIRDKIHSGGAWQSGRPSRPYKRTRPKLKIRRRQVERILADAAINDPDDMQELFDRATL